MPKKKREQPVAPELAALRVRADKILKKTEESVRQLRLHDSEIRKLAGLRRRGKP